jgi:ribonuclease P protein component
MAPLVAARFPRSLRLAGRAEFDAVLKTRNGIAGAQMTVIARPNGGRPARLGLIVPKALAARAVDRNYVRRVAREQFRQAQAVVQGLDVIVRLRRPFLRAGRRDLGREIAALLAQAAGGPRRSGH